jgi:hypothetical protein
MQILISNSNCQVYNLLKREVSMRVPRLPVLIMLTSLSVATAAAQSTPQNTEARLNLFQFQLASGLAESSPTRPAQTAPSDGGSLVIPVLGPHVPFRLTINDSDGTCLTLRTYRVAREHPDSDAVTPAGYSTCQPSSRFQVKTAVDSYPISPR